MGAEDKLQNAIINYVNCQYNVVPIPCNTESKKSKFEQFKYKFMGGRKGTLDLFIPHIAGGYGGLFIELKAEGRKVFKKSGEVLKNETLQNQYETIQRHLQSGYYAAFAIGFNHAKKIIDEYFNQ